MVSKFIHEVNEVVQGKALQSYYICIPVSETGVHVCFLFPGQSLRYFVGQEPPCFNLVSDLLSAPTPWSPVFLQKLIVTQLAKKFPAFYGTLRFITMFTTIRHWTLS